VNTSHPFARITIARFTFPPDFSSSSSASSRPAPVTAQMIRLATEMRQRALAELRAVSAKAAGDPTANAELEREWRRYGDRGSDGDHVRDVKHGAFRYNHQ